MELSSAFTLDMLGQPFLLEKRIELLLAIKEHGSISKAAKAVPMSYKSAWEAVDVMNTLSTQPIVEKETGGKNGGGTTITTYGIKLLDTYKVLKEEHSRFLQRLAEVTNIESGEVKTIGRLALQLSARNQIQAEVLSVTTESVNAKIVLKLKGGQELISVITKEAVENLHLAQGQSVTAIIKSSAVLVSSTTKTMQVDNRLKGVVEKIDTDSHNAKIVVDIGKGDKIVSVLPLEVFEVSKCISGDEVMVGIKSNDIILGR
jgi:molybdate transport system regulatory protein